MPPNEKTEEVKPAVKPKEKEEDKTDLVSYIELLFFNFDMSLSK